MTLPTPSSKKLSSRSQVEREPAHSLRSLRGGALLIGMTLLSALAVSCNSGETDINTDATSLAAVTRGRLRVSVREGGDLQSAAPTEVRSEVEGRNAIIELVPEGTLVKKGDKVVVLDSASLVNNINRQQIAVDGARSKVAQAKESYAIQEKQNQEALQDAQTKLQLAQRALEGYRRGTMPLQQKELESDLMLAQESMKRAQNEAEASARLHQKEIIAKSELEADVLNLTQATERVNVAEGRLSQYLEWTSKDEIQRLESDVKVRGLALERVEQQVRSELAQRQDAVLTAERNLKLETEQLDKYVAQLDKCTLYAPRDGLLVYASRSRGGRMGGEEPISLGTEIREREAVVNIPDLHNLIVRVDIHESSIKKVERNQRAWVKVDAVPGKTFEATVQSVGLVPSTQSSWMNPDLKVYETYVRIDEQVEGLKPGMFARVEILVAELEDVLQVPLQAVHQSGTRTFVYVQKGGASELREVEVGENNDSAVHIKKGLAEGEMVFMTKPQGAEALPEPEREEFLEKAPPATAGAGTAPSDTGARRPMDDGNVPGGPSASGDSAAPAESGERRPGRGTRGQMTPEQRAAMQERLKGMSEEERAKFMEGMRRGAGAGGEGGRARPAGTGDGK